MNQRTYYESKAGVDPRPADNNGRIHCHRQNSSDDNKNKPKLTTRVDIIKYSTRLLRQCKLTDDSIANFITNKRTQYHVQGMDVSQLNFSEGGVKNSGT